MSLYRLSVTMLPAIVKGLHTKSTMLMSIVDKANERATQNT